MNVASNNRDYKVISLLIKTAIFIFSFWFIFEKIKTSSIQFNISAAFEKENAFLLFLTFGLMFVNWGLEALKWRFLISPLERITFRTSLKSIFAGVTVSIFMPNRVGEFAGRIFFLEKADKIQAVLKNFIGSIMQFLITVFFGAGAIFIFMKTDLSSSINNDFFGLRSMKFFLIISLVLLTAVLFFNKYRSRFSERTQLYFRTVFDTPKKDLMITFLISLLRYLVFMTQYILVLRSLEINPDFMTAFVLIAITFLITSVVPSFALTEIATRGAAAVFLFGAVTGDSIGVMTASFIVWFINLALPALIGTAFIWKLKFFK